MGYLYLLMAVGAASGVNIFGAAFTKAHGKRTDSVPFYNLFMSAFACLFWLVMYILEGGFDASVLWYSLLFGVMYYVVVTCYILALKNGPASITSLFSGLSLLGSTVWGYLFWDMPVKTLHIVGIVLVALSVFLCVYEKKKEGERGFSWRWLLFASLTFLANAGCAVVQKQQQLDFGGEHGNMMMFFAMLLAVAANLVSYLRAGKGDPCEIKKSVWIPMASGVANGVQNLAYILLATAALSPSVYFPVIGVAMVLFTTLYSRFVLKETLSARKWVGVFVGLAAVALLNL